ncbi:MAG TPA: glycosyltransferase family 4 protein [Nitrospiraceae bacterium]|nr:glycosyltransferase family 4 protein [Nitrospiraceae bacterium]
MHTVCHIITKLELGGAQKITLRTMAHLDRSRFLPVLIIGGEVGGLDADATRIMGTELYRVPSLVRVIRPVQDVKALFSLTRLLRRIRPTIVHTHSSKAGILGRWAARLAGVPVIVHSVHGFGFTPTQHPVLKRFLIVLERWSSAFTQWVFTDSEANRRQGIGLGLFTEDRSAMLPPGIDLHAIRAVRIDRDDKRRSLGLDPMRPLIGMVAPFKPQKSPLDFVRVAVRVLRQRSDAHFVMVGDGELRQAVEAEIRRLSLVHSITLTGWRRDVPEIMKCLDVFLLTSGWEGLPRVYLEALSCGVPTVGTCVDGAAEVVIDGVNGFLKDPGDIEGLADRVLWLLNHSEEAKAMGSQGMSISKKFDCYEVVRQQEYRYEWLVANIQKDDLPHAPERATHLNT